MKPKVDMGRCLSEGWRLYRAAWLTWSLATLIVLIVASIGAMLFVVPALIVAPPLVAGMYHMAFQQMRGETPQVSDIFWGFSRMMDSVLLIFVVALLSSLGSMLCIVPGLVFSAWYMFALPLMVEKGLSWADAMSESKRVVSENLWEFVVFSMLLGTMAGLGSYLCGVGILATLPLFYLTGAVAYRELFGLEGVDA